MTDILVCCSSMLGLDLFILQHVSIFIVYLSFDFLYHIYFMPSHLVSNDCY